MTDQTLRKILETVAEHDCHDALIWTKDLRIFAKCSDVFWWGTADGEEITEDNAEVFFKAMEDAGWDGPALFAARQRKMRPQGAVYGDIDREHWPLFDACGPMRETGLGNPKKQPDATH